MNAKMQYQAILQQVVHRMHLLELFESFGIDFHSSQVEMSINITHSELAWNLFLPPASVCDDHTRFL